MTMIIQIVTAIALILSIIIPGGAFLLGERNKKRYKKSLAANCFFFFGTLLVGTIAMFAGAQNVQAATDAAGKQVEEGYNDPRGVMCSAYRNVDGKWVMVAINYSEDVKPITLQVAGMSRMEWEMYRTSDVSSESLAPVGKCMEKAVLAPRSITTFVQE